MHLALLLTGWAPSEVHHLASENTTQPNLLSEHFDGDLSNWTESLGAGAGSPPSTVTWPAPGNPSPGLSLSGDSKTKRWTALSRDITASPGDTLIVTADAKTIDVRKERGQRSNCHVSVWVESEHGKKSGVKALQYTGTTKWLTKTSVNFIPADTTRTELAVFLSMSGTFLVDNIEVQKIEGNWSERRTARTRYHHQQGDQRPSRLTDERLEREITRLEGLLQGQISGEIHYWLYPSEPEKRRRTGTDGNGYYNGSDAIHSIWAVHVHELVHLVVAKAWGRSDSAFWTKGSPCS